MVQARGRRRVMEGERVSSVGFPQDKRQEEGDGGREGELRGIPAGPECIHSTSGVSVRASLTLRCS